MRKYLSNNFDCNKVVDFYDEIPIWSSPFGIKLLDYIDYKINITALDIGCGTGFPLIELAMRLGENSIIYGIDPWKEAIGKVKNKIDYYQLANVQIIEGVAESIPLDNESVDLIVSNNGINNVNSVDKVFYECSRVIKEGGQFIFTFNTDRTMIEFYTEYEKILSELKLHNEIHLLNKHIHKKRPPVDEIINKVEKYGFIVNEMVEDQFNYKFTDGSAMLNHYFICLAFMESWVKLLPRNKVGLVFDLIEKNLNELSEKQGVFKLTIPFVLINSIKK
ncbi:MAG: methyltransferase domain-containing protein [Ignavibacteriales bacterium]|nr:methyltransferase domain-containing protein [Ignavibacteriales bacterium]